MSGAEPFLAAMANAAAGVGATGVGAGGASAVGAAVAAPTATAIGATVGSGIAAGAKLAGTALLSGGIAKALAPGLPRSQKAPTRDDAFSALVNKRPRAGAAANILTGKGGDLVAPTTVSKALLGQ